MRKPVKLKKIMLDFLVKKLRQATASWRTTASGVALVLLGAGGLINLLVVSQEPVTLEAIGLQVALITSGVGLIAAKDNLTSTRDVPKQ